MTSFLETHLRLAERRGLLTGRSLSPVQDLGLRLLYRADNLVAATARTERLRLSLVASDPDAAPRLFPEFFPEEKTTVETLDEAPEGAAIDYTAVAWMSGDKAKDEYERLMSELASDDVEVVGADAGGGDWQ